MKTRSFLSDFKEAEEKKSLKDPHSKGPPSIGAATRIRATLSARKLLNNYALIAEMAQGQMLLPMIKANGYGHGDVWVARQLAGRAQNLYGFGVASLAEGAHLRSEIGAKHRKLRIFVFSDTSPWSDEKGEFCLANHLTPVLSSEADWELFTRQKWQERISYELKFNTGMNRLGLGLGSISKIKADLKKMTKVEHQPTGILTHLACADDPNARLTQIQLEKFWSLQSELHGVTPNAHFHVANSAALFNFKKMALADHTTVVRPGLALYGVPPMDKISAQGIEPVMKLEVRVIHRHTLKPGESLGYGGTYRVPKDSAPVHIAVCAAGYADGVHRALSGDGTRGGHAVIGGRAFRFLGRVSMDLLTIECGRDTQVGEWVEILGTGIDTWAQAKEAGTVPYELLTSVSNRVEREYVD